MVGRQNRKIVMRLSVPRWRLSVRFRTYGQRTEAGWPFGCYSTGMKVTRPRISPVIDDNSLDTILALITQLEATLLGLKQMRSYVGSSIGEQMLELLIEEGEAKVAEFKRKVIQ